MNKLGLGNTVTQSRLWLNALIMNVFDQCLDMLSTKTAYYLGSIVL